jgi:ceramide glucosyltransferase
VIRTTWYDWLLLGLVAGSCVFCVLVVIACRRWRREPPGRLAEPVSVLKPLRGADLGLEANLRSFFEQRYESPFELVFAMEDETDLAFLLCQRLIREYAHVDARIVLTGRPFWDNAKVWQLAQAWDSLKYDLVVMSDSDIRVDADFLAGLEPWFDVGTCPYRAVGGPSYWSSLEAVGMNTEFLAGVLVARMLGGMDFAVGPTLYCRKAVIRRIGGWQELSEFLAEDFVLGHRASQRGFQVGLSRQIVEHRIGSEDFETNFQHRLRWYRSTRRSRPWGYVGQLFTMPMPLILAMVVVRPDWWWIGFVAAGIRVAAAAETAGAVKAPFFPGLFVQDLLSFGLWLLGFFGSTIEWRGRRYRLHFDGRFTRLTN